MLVVLGLLCALCGNGSKEPAGTRPEVPAAAAPQASTGGVPGQDKGGRVPAAVDRPEGQTPVPSAMDPVTLLFPGEERHLRNVRQLTHGHSPGYASDDFTANYAEAYWSPDGTKLILQATRDQYPCDQEFVMDVASGEMTLVSTGKGRVTCGYFTDETGFIYSSTHEVSDACPPPADMSKGYVWPLYDYDIFFNVLGSKIPPTNVSHSPGYDAESTIDWNTGWIYFTSTRDGDLDIYRTRLGEQAVERLTNELGYDGGPFVSYDGKTVVYRRQEVKPEEAAEYKELLAEKLVKPTNLELWAMDADGGNKRQLTHLGGANFAPFLSPDNKTVIFCSNHNDPHGRTFELCTVPLAGGEIEQVTHGGEFDGFPMISPDGKYLAWCSNRNGTRPRETNVFVAEWLP